MPRPTLLIVLATAALLGCCSESAKGDTLELTSGVTLDGKVLKEEGGFVWVKTLQKIEKIPSADVKSRTPGESKVERLDKLRAAAEKEPIQVAALYDLVVFQKENLASLPVGTDKENARLLQKILKRDPEHAGAHDAIGDVLYDGGWVKKTDVPRLDAEKARQRIKVEWQERLKVPVEVYEADHFLLVDNTGEKDLEGRAKALDNAYQALSAALGVEVLWKDRANIVTIKAYDDYVRALTGFAGEASIPANIVAAAKEPATGGLWRHRPIPFQLRWPATGSEGMWSAITHNVAHLTMWTLWIKSPEGVPPAWIDEGMGAWVEIEVMGQQVNYCMGESKKREEPRTGGTTDKRPSKKKDPKKNASDLGESRNEYKEICKQAMLDDSFPAMRMFLKYGVGDVGPPEEGGVLALVTWLMQQDAEKFKKLVGLLRKGNKRTEDEYWRESYGFELIEDMEKIWRGWVVGEW